MPAKSGFHLTPDDIDFLRCVYALRVATIDHLAALSWREGQSRSYTRTQKRTKKLAANGYLDALTRQPRKIIYALGKDGLAALAHIGHVPEELVDKRPRNKELKDLFLRHLLMVKDAQVKLMVLARDTSIRIHEWREGPEIYDSVTVEEKRGMKTVSVRHPVRPDAFLVLQDTARPEGKNLLPFVLEADCSTERHKVIHNKIRAYVHYFQQQRCLEKWGCRFFKVLLITKSTERPDRLRTSCQPLIPPQLQPHYVFTPLDGLTLDMLIPQ